ncbi:MAG: phosphatase PAP2-related protein [Patescibacteria group bacterium]
MKSILASYRRCFADRRFVVAFFLSFLFFCAGIVVSTLAGFYATVRASNYVEDIVLSNIPSVRVDDLFVVGTFVIIVFVLCLLLTRPHWVPYTLSSLALFYIVRAVFISLTHLGPFPDRVEVVDWGTIVAKFIGGNDLFFSGHTGAPFLLALIFWQTKPLRYVFLAWSAFFATIVLLGHLHYSIDVLAAFFITYGVFHTAELFFKKYRTIFHEGIQP